MSQRRPAENFDEGLQHERTALAWERTAGALMVAGVLLARYASADAYPGIGVIGLMETAFGGGLLVWAGRHYDDLHGPLRSGDSVVHPTAARLAGLATVAFTTMALILALVVTIWS
ncbi:MAG: DUF202 domain-containing protein [Acidimicrobiia bacterium]|nr:DUF202 domain-containing protein [Acidimicrobiia bacterium]